MTRLLARFTTALVVALLAAQTFAKSTDGRKHARSASGVQRYIVIYEDEPLVHRLTRETGGATASAESTAMAAEYGTPRPGHRVDARSPRAVQVLQRIERRQSDLEAEAAALLGRELKPVHRYRMALNGIATDMTPNEAKRLSRLDGVARVVPDTIEKPHTDAGPPWIGAPAIWNGVGIPGQSRGEGVVVGLIDSGINWDHLSFQDPGEGGGGQHDHENPLGETFGLCSEPDVDCNDKLIGVYDFVEDNPNTDEVEENNGGRDNSNHGTHVGGILVGNPVLLTIDGQSLEASGVAPNANIISYRVCYVADPDTEDDDGCQRSAILAAIDQAIEDGVDVINYSIGSGSVDPWGVQPSLAFLGAYEAGVFVSTSAGNDGPLESTVGSPAMAPWITAVGNATHDRFFANVLNATSGGSTMPPGALDGASFNNQGVGLTDIVYAGDYGNALCGTGAAELGPACADNTGATNPFEPGTFDGQIVVCDRGTYGRVEKGKNVMDAGAAGYVLANTNAQGEVIVADEHCLPGTHIGAEDGNRLRQWLAGGSGHRASLSGLTTVHRDSTADILHFQSSRGPTPPPVEDVLKPNLIAPGQEIWSALGVDFDSGEPSPNGFIALTGTSMSSPHIAGGAALLKSLEPSWTPSMIASALTLTATAELARDEDGQPATPHLYGHGRPRLGEAANAGLYLDETVANFEDADPFVGGEPRNLNLPAMMDANCAESCSFTRVVKPIVSGQTWTATAAGFPQGVDVTVTPGQFTLTGEQELTVTVNVNSATVFEEWVFGEVQISSSGLPTAVMPMAVYASGGELPQEWTISTDRGSGSQDFTLSGLAEIEQGVYTAGGLVAPETTSMDLVEDPTYEEPYDGGQGVFSFVLNVPDNTMWLGARTLASDAHDLDLFVGIDLNGNGQPDSNEEICSSLTQFDLETCDIFEPQSGQWWVLVQNWEDCDPENPSAGCEGASQEASVRTAVVVQDDAGELTATGPGIVPAGESFPARLSWDNVAALPSQPLWGAVGIGRSQANPNDIGIVPVVFNRTGMGEPATRVLMDGRPHRFALGAGDRHEKMIFDVPGGVTELTVTASGDTAAQNDGLRLELYRQNFADAFGSAPEAGPLPGGSPLAAANGAGGSGPAITRNAPNGGRWYAVVENTSGSPAEVTIQTDFTHGGTAVPLSGGLWHPSSRPGISQGFEYNVAGGARTVIWYTYDESGSPVWYLAAASSTDGNTWTADLLHFTNDGQAPDSSNFGKPVGEASVTLLGENDAIFSWTLFGVSGSDRTTPLARNCPQVDGEKQSFSGLWYRPPEGLGGASIVVNLETQGQIHYLYDDQGSPFWLIGSGSNSPGSELVLEQFQGFCPNCTGTATPTTVGTITPQYDSESEGSWRLDYLLEAPLSGNVDRTDSVQKLTNAAVCP